MCVFRLGALILVLLVTWGRAVLAQDVPDPKFGLPIYDPVAKRYFAFMKAQDLEHYGGTWENAAKQAQEQVYKGVRGRLAIVDSGEVHEFLQLNFHPKYFQYAWIGLRYLCRAKKLEWTDGKMWQAGSFQAWDKNWKQDVYFCTDVNDPNDWAPVAYSPQTFTWIGKGRHKGYDYYFIEFPTGGP